MALGAGHRSASSDVLLYKIYWGLAQNVPIVPGNLRSTTTDTTFTDAYFANYWYKVTALDIHGNESDGLSVQPEATLGVPGARVTAAFLAEPWPNPSTGRSTLRFGLAHDSAAHLAVYDQQGRRVRTLDGGALSAGEHVISWDGRDEAGHDAAPGLYFVRASLEGQDFTRRLVRVR